MWPTTGSIEAISIAPAGATDTFTSPKPKLTAPLIIWTSAVPVPAPCACTVPSNCSPSALARLRSTKQYPAPLSRLNHSGSEPLTLTGNKIMLFADSNRTTALLWWGSPHVTTGFWLSWPAANLGAEKDARRTSPARNQRFRVSALLDARPAARDSRFDWLAEDESKFRQRKPAVRCIPPLYKPALHLVLNLFAASRHACGPLPVIFLTLRVMWDWSANPQSAAIPASGASVVRIAFQAWRVRARALRAEGETSNTRAKPRDRAHGAIFLISLQCDKLRDGYRIRAAASSSGQSQHSGSCIPASERSSSAASALFLSAIRTIASGSSILPQPA